MLRWPRWCVRLKTFVQPAQQLAPSWGHDAYPMQLKGNLINWMLTWKNHASYEFWEQDQKHKEVQRKRINCNSFYNGNVEIFIHANGNISPCCWLGDLSIHESKNIIDDYKSVNIRHSSLEEILEGNYFNALWRGIKGEPQSYKLQTCENVCGECHE